MSPDVTAVSATIVGNCCRCGVEFRLSEKARVCPACRKPKQGKPALAGRHLTFREKQIVELVSEGKLNKEIAYELHLSHGTVKEYLNTVFRKLNVKNRTELAVWWLRQPEEDRLTSLRLQIPVNTYPKESRSRVQ
jgi:DNA-binding NarL/FixJ family response regulator